ncbi:MarR family winged helix-turn-helix transcriptional regulator [Nocardioides sp.]|uniref:MarR family winged helix-turn-helix transcriptional regulator n=1 Tax=Nocardioides sp. TaxID=35761 RepID=UPI0035643E7B
MDGLRATWEESESLRALRQVTQAAVRVRPMVAKRAGLGHSELVALEHLMAGPMGPGELARRLEVTTAASTGVVDRLEQRGHVTRVAHSGDRRRTDVVITDSGRAEVQALLRPMFAALQDLDDSLDETERRVVAGYLRGVLSAFESVSGPLPAAEPGAEPAAEPGAAPAAADQRQA